MYTKSKALNISTRVSTGYFSRGQNKQKYYWQTSENQGNMEKFKATFSQHKTYHKALTDQILSPFSLAKSNLSDIKILKL